MKRDDEHLAHRSRGGRPSTRILDGPSLVVEALTFFGSQPAEAERFFAWSGLDAGGLRAAADDSGFVDGVLDYLVENLKSLERFCAIAEIDPGAVLRLRESRTVRGLTSHDEP